MTVRDEFVFDRESAAQTGGSDVRAGRLLVATAVLIAIVIVIVIAMQLVSGPTPRLGTQATPAESFVLESAAFSGWEPLVSLSGELRAGYPAPVVWTADRVCIGFARLDFGPDDLRPSLARCERHSTGNIAVNEIRSLVSVRAGFDTWHFVEAADHIESIAVYLASGERVSDDRILLSGSIGALRLENDRDLASVEWSTRSSTYRCPADPTAWRSSVFCAARR
jgi:hypothetical protein